MNRTQCATQGGTAWWGGSTVEKMGKNDRGESACYRFSPKPYRMEYCRHCTRSGHLVRVHTVYAESCVAFSPPFFCPNFPFSRQRNPPSGTFD